MISIWVPLVCAVIIVVVLPLIAGYIVLMERKVMADMQARLGPMRVGPHGLLQPIADALKLLIKEDIIPDKADKSIFWFAPLISVTAAMLAMSALAIGPWFQIAELNIGLLFVVGISALGLFGIVLGGWASNSHYSLLGALRSAAQLVSYETAAGMAIVGALLLAGTLSMREIIQRRITRHWFVFLRAGRILHLPCRLDRGDQSRAIRFAGSRIGTRRRLYDGIQRLPLVALFPRGIRQHDRGRVHRHHVVSRRLAAAVCRNAGVQFPGWLSLVADGCSRGILLLPRAEATRSGAKTFHGGRWADDVCCGARSGIAAGSGRREHGRPD